MIEMTSIETEKARIAFVERAAEHFAKNPKHYSYGDIEPGGMVGLRWGSANDCVLVLKLDEYAKPAIYEYVIAYAERKVGAA